MGEGSHRECNTGPVRVGTRDQRWRQGAGQGEGAHSTFGGRSENTLGVDDDIWRSVLYGIYGCTWTQQSDGEIRCHGDLPDLGHIESYHEEARVFIL